MQQRRRACFYFSRKRALQTGRVGDVNWLWDARETSGVSILAGREHSTGTIRAFPFFPVLRNECYYEELTFVASLAWRYRPKDYDITVTCSYPFTNWLLRKPCTERFSPAARFRHSEWRLAALGETIRRKIGVSIFRVRWTGLHQS